MHPCQCKGNILVNRFNNALGLFVEGFVYHFNLSFAPAENVDDFNTSPISSLQKLKLFIVHMQLNFTTLTCAIGKKTKNNINKYEKQQLLSLKIGGKIQTLNEMNNELSEAKKKTHK